MIQTIQKTWMIIALLCATISAFAYDFESEGLYYNILSEEDRTVEVVKNENEKYNQRHIEIPRKAIYESKTYTVISIGTSAFSACGLTSVTIPNSVTSIGRWAFLNCQSLTSVTIPNSVNSIGAYAFESCSSLSSVTIGNSVKSIGNYAFCGCKSLTSVTIGNSVKSIGNYAFRGCKSLTSVTIPNSVTSIGDCAFLACRNLTSLTIPNSVTSIGSSAFSSCESLENINVDSENVYFSSIDGILYNKSITNLICCPGAKISMTIPNSVSSIGESSFYYCRSLTSVTIPNSVNSIGAYAFYHCNNLKTIYIQCEVPIECDPVFSDEILKETVLYVPTGTKAKYEKVDPWRNFWNIEEMDFSGVDGIDNDLNLMPHISVNNGILTIDGINAPERVTVYDMQGRIVYNGTSHTIDNLPTGLYLVKLGSRTIRISI